MIKKLNIVVVLIIFISLNSYSQKDSISNSSTETSKDINIKDAQFVLVLKKTEVSIDTLTMKKINPDWVDKVEVIRFDNSIIRETPTKSTILIYIKRKYIDNAKGLLNNK